MLRRNKSDSSPRRLDNQQFTEVTGLKAEGLETPKGNETGFINRNLPLAPP